jgi:DNA primase
MTISENIIEKIRVANNIESIIREYLPDLKKVGRNWKAPCPFHDERTPSFVVSPERGIFRCFGCDVSGDVFKFVMLFDNISWIEAVKKLAEKANIAILEIKQDTVKISEKARLFDILKKSAMFYHICLLESPNARKAREYLEKRGVTRETMGKFKLGFAVKDRSLRLLLNKYCCTIDNLLKSGLVAKNASGSFFEYMSDRIVFPIFDVQGRVVAFGGRTITNQQPKYLNTPETIIYSKSANLYGLFQTLPELRKERKTIVLEGYIDVLIPQQAGIIGAVGILGTAFSQYHAKLISRYSDSVTLLFDSDKAGRIATQKALEILVENDMESKVSVLPENIDADEYINKLGKESFLKLLKEDYKSAICFMIMRASESASLSENKTSPEIKAKIVSILLDFVFRSSNFVIQREWIRIIAQSINVDEEAVWKEFEKKQRLKVKSYYIEDTKNLKMCIKNRVVSMSLEENLLNILFNNRSYIQRVDSIYFKTLICKKVFNLMVSGLSDTDILDTLSPEDRNWFSELILNSVHYNDVEESFNVILKDIKLKLLKQKRCQIEENIILMSEGKKEKDEKAFYEYQKLTVFLKGSRK